MNVLLRHTIVLALLFSGLLPWATSESFAAEFPRQSRVLVVYGNPDIGPWEQNFNEIILHDLATQSAVPVIPEFLDLIQSNNEDQRLIAESLRLKYSRISIDLVIAVLPEANSFVFNWKETFAPSARVLHVVPGTDVLDAELQLPNSQLIDSSVHSATERTVALIPQLFPQIEHIYLIGGNSDGDRSYLERFETAIQEASVTMEYTLLRGLTPPEILAELENPIPNSAIVMSTYDRDRTGEALRTMAVNTMLSENKSMPIFSVFDTLIGSGTLGGNVSSSTLYANATSRLANDMLSGQSTADVTYAETSYLFNGALLDRFNVDRERLPLGSVIINDNPDLWRDYADWIIGGLVVISLQLALIAALIFTMRRRRLAESQLKQAQRMEALGSLSGGIAHDFNNILMSIMANAELVKNDAANPGLVTQRSKNILNASDRARDLIAQILMFSKQSAGFNPQPVILNKIVSDCIEQLRSFLPASCVVEFEPDTKLLAIPGDVNQLEQVITNICVNAQHAMNDEGLISIITRQVHLAKTEKALDSEVPAGNYNVLEITDTGSGIAPKDIRHVFEPFYTTKPRGKGTGLGLAMVYRILQAHGAYINVQSAVGKGTSVQIYFPVSDHSVIHEEDSADRVLKMGSGETILLVDDDEMVLDANRQTLLALGYKVSALGHPLTALATLKASPQTFDLVFSDLTMPEMDGVTLVKEMRKIRSDLPAIICTGYSESLEPDKQQGFIILPKPCSAVDIADTLYEALH